MMDEEKQMETPGTPDATAADPAAEAPAPEATPEVSAEAASVADVAEAGEAETPATLEELDLQEAEESPAADDAIPALDATALVEVLRENEALKAQVEDRTSQYARLTADFDNFRKRTQKEREELEVRLKCDTIRELLPVVDNFERARSHIKPQTDAEMNIHKSYQSVYKQLVDCLKRVGVAPMRPEGQPFDPNLHEAVLREQTDRFPEGTVVEELQRGYLLGERVLRHAMVKVAAAPESVVASDEESSDSTES